MHQIIMELHRLACDAQALGMHLHLHTPIRLALGSVLNELRRLVKAAGGPRVVAGEALHMLEEATEQGSKAWPDILREAADILAEAQKKADAPEPENESKHPSA